MVYTTKFFKVRTFRRFKYLNAIWIKVGRNLFTNGTDGTNYTIPTLGTDVTVVDDKFRWTGSPLPI